MAKPTVALVALAVSVACGGSPAQPTTPPAPSQTFTVTADVPDSQGRVASRTQSAVVKRLVGSWFHAAYNPSVQRTEVRRLDVQSQDGRTIRGVYQRSGAADQPFTGTLLPSGSMTDAPHDVRIAAGTTMTGVTTLAGTIPDELSELWPLDVRGDGYNGERLNFRAVIGEPTGPAPDASLTIRMDSFGSTVAIAALTEIDFDGSGSRGDGLSYFIDFGDGEFAAAPRALHVVEPAVPYTNVYTARMTVVDRFGRANTESLPYALFRLPGGAAWWISTTSGDFLRFTFDGRSGVRYEGRIRYLYPDGVIRTVSCTAILSGERDIRIVVDSLGLEFRGYIDMTTSVYNPKGYSSIAPPVILTQYGGPHDGRTWTLKYFDPH